MSIQDMQLSDIEAMQSGLRAICQALDEYREFKATWDINRSQLETLAQAASEALAAYTTALNGRQISDSIRQTLESAARDRRADLEQSRRALEAQSEQLDRLLSVPLAEAGQVQTGLITHDTPGLRTNPVGDGTALGLLDPGAQGPRDLTLYCPALRPGALSPVRPKHRAEGSRIQDSAQGQRALQSEPVEVGCPPEAVPIPASPAVGEVEAGNGDGLAFEDLFEEEAPDGPPARDDETGVPVAEPTELGDDEEGLWASLLGEGTGGPIG